MPRLDLCSSATRVIGLGKKVRHIVVRVSQVIVDYIHMQQVSLLYRLASGEISMCNRRYPLDLGCDAPREKEGFNTLSQSE